MVALQDENHQWRGRVAAVRCELQVLIRRKEQPTLRTLRELLEILDREMN